MSSSYDNYKGLTYRICYGLTESGNMDFSKEIYEFHKDCKCGYCKSRFNNTRGTFNNLTITTSDKNKFQEISTILENYTCNSSSSKPIQYMHI